MVLSSEKTPTGGDGGLGDVIYTKVARLNENHEKLANAHPKKAKKVKGVSKVKKAKKDTIRPPRVIIDATAVDAVVDTEIVNQLPPVVVPIVKVKHSVRLNDNVNFDLDDVLDDEILPLGDTTIPETDEEGWPNVDGVQSMETDGNNPVEENLPSPVSGKRMNVF